MPAPVILVALDPSDLESQGHILSAAQAEAQGRGGRLVLILVVEAMRHAGHGAAFAEMRRDLMQEAADRADRWAEGIVGAGTTETHVAYGDADEQILAAAQRLGAAVVVMGERRRRAIGALLGSVAASVNDAAAIPVVLVPPVH